MNGISRRSMLLGAGAVAACCLTHAGPSLAIPRPRRGLIDVHHHIRPPGVPEAFARLTAQWSPAGAIEDMARNGVAAGIAYPGPVLVGSDQEKRARARGYNEFGATLARDHPGRFGLFASLPFDDVEGSLAEIDFAYDSLHADGFGLATSYGELWLGDARFWPIYEKLNERAAVIFVHPADAACCGPARMSYTQGVMDGSWIEWPMNTARTILSLISSGTLRRFPRIRFIFAHGGGVMPLLVRRLAGFEAWPAVGEAGLRRFFPEGVQAAFAALYFECAQAYAPTNLGAVRSLVPDSRLLFGSDYPIFPMSHATNDFAAARLPAAARRSIGRSNVEALLPRWANAETAS